MQRPKEMTLFPTEPKTRETFLMLFEDYQRIDLTLCPLAEKDNWHEGDSLAIILLDKDENLPPLPVASDKNYTVTVRISSNLTIVAMNFGGLVRM